MASNKITEITSYFSKGFQRTNKFEVEFSRNNATFWASQCQIPQQYIAWYPEFFTPSGPTVHIPLKRDFDENFLIDFIVESDWAVRKYFETWYDDIFSSLTNGRSNTVDYRDANLSRITIKALNDNGNTNATITIYEAYPKLLLPSQFSNDIPNQYLTLSVNFNYRYYRIT